MDVPGGHCRHAQRLKGVIPQRGGGRIPDTAILLGNKLMHSELNTVEIEFFWEARIVSAPAMHDFT